MDAQSIKDTLARSGFVFTDLDSGARVAASGPQVPGPVGVKSRVRVQKNGETLHTSTHSNNATAARKYVELVEEYDR
jgi:hypothetical protein